MASNYGYTRSPYNMQLYRKTNFKEEGTSSETNSHSASQELTRILRNPKVHYDVHKSPPRVTNTSQMNEVQTLPSYFFKIQFNTTHLFTPRSSEWSLPFRFSDQNFVCISSFPCVLRAPPISSPW